MMKKFFVLVLAVSLIGCSFKWIPKTHKTTESTKYLSQYENYSFNFDEWRRYVNPVTGFTFLYNNDLFNLDNMLSIINLLEIEKPDVLAYYKMEEQKIEDSSTNSYSTFYSNDEIQINTYREIGKMKGKYEINISNRGVSHTFIFYKNNRRVALTASRSFSPETNYNMISYFNDLKNKDVQFEENNYFKMFYSSLSTLANYTGSLKL